MPTIKHTPQSIAELERERDQFKLERDSLIKDVDYQRNQKFEHFLGNQMLEQENEALKLQVQEERKKYKTLVNHIRHKAVANPSEHRYFNLVHFIDDMEGN
ncbi:hypothetical protein [Mammaliicoccus fleurettii]|uniref:hypothetical protein n=1 Tax=Mammaliicoccus fleurettii TaxID=150056 RepID=UPI00099218B3|nr:hypothetical protein [Mammaliicoccus fleurettii]OOV78884.1 hypothetical protein B2G86_00735 [Mammaliicoccus fleurettii]